MQPKVPPRKRYCLDVAAAYNRESLPLPGRRNGRQVPTIEDVMAHPFLWARLSQRDAEELLMEIYVARRRRMQ